MSQETEACAEKVKFSETKIKAGLLLAERCENLAVSLLKHGDLVPGWEDGKASALVAQLGELARTVRAALK